MNLESNSVWKGLTFAMWHEKSKHVHKVNVQIFTQK